MREKGETPRKIKRFGCSGLEERGLDRTEKPLGSHETDQTAVRAGGVSGSEWLRDPWDW